MEICEVEALQAIEEELWSVAGGDKEVSHHWTGWPL